jgi:hypothetical protein
LEEITGGRASVHADRSLTSHDRNLGQDALDQVFFPWPALDPIAPGAAIDFSRLPTTKPQPAWRDASQYLD